jgi:hypothetical protein
MATDLVNRTYQLKPELAQRIKEAAQRLNVWDSDLAAALLTYALDQLDAGAWAPKRRPAWYTLAPGYEEGAADA